MCRGSKGRTKEERCQPYSILGNENVPLERAVIVRDLWGSHPVDRCLGSFRRLPQNQRKNAMARYQSSAAA